MFQHLVLGPSSFPGSGLSRLVRKACQAPTPSIPNICGVWYWQRVDAVRGTLLMPTDFLRTLEREIAELQAELDADPRFQKLERLRSVLPLYRGTQSDMPKVAATTINRPMRENRSEALRIAAMMLRSRADPVPTRDIYEYVVANGGEIGGKAPVNNLSAMLSNSDEFVSSGREGWTLVDRDDEPARAEAEREARESRASDAEADGEFERQREHHEDRAADYA